MSIKSIQVKEMTDEDLSEEHIKNGGSYFSVSSIGVYPNGTKIIYTTNLDRYYVHKDNNTLHKDDTLYKSHICLDENIITDPIFKEYMFRKIKKHIDDTLYKAKQDKKLLKELRCN